MEPRIQYATTADGVNIAFWAIGEGKPFVHMPWFRSSHIQREWQIPEYRRWYDNLAKNLCLIRYDGRGIGMSDREVSEYSLDALVADLEAVVDRLKLETVALFGVLHMGPVAIAYAARHPERVSHLVLWCTYARSSDYARSTQVQATRGFMDKDWELYTQTICCLNPRKHHAAGAPGADRGVPGPRRFGAPTQSQSAHACPPSQRAGMAPGRRGQRAGRPNPRCQSYATRRLVRRALPRDSASVIQAIDRFLGLEEIQVSWSQRGWEDAWSRSSLPIS